MATKSVRDLLEQRDRLSRRITERARAAARVAHPATDGSPHLCHNWGNEGARAAWAMERERHGRMTAIAQRVIDRVAHVAWHTQPGWDSPSTCEHCAAVAATRRGRRMVRS